MTWDKSFATRADPSGRAAGAHDASCNVLSEANNEVTKKEEVIA